MLDKDRNLRAFDGAVVQPSHDSVHSDIWSLAALPFSWLQPPLGRTWTWRIVFHLCVWAMIWSVQFVLLDGLCSLLCGWR